MNPSADAHADVTAQAAQGDAGERRQADRRQSPTSSWGAFPLAGRRMRNRRHAEHRRPYFVDRFSPVMFLLILMLIVASLVDALLTIQLLDAGAEEINPLMDRLLAPGALPFVIGKYLLTVAGLPLLLIFQNHYLFRTRLRVGHLIPILVGAYLVLIGYQLILMRITFQG